MANVADCRLIFHLIVTHLSRSISHKKFVFFRCQLLSISRIHVQERTSCQRIPSREFRFVIFSGFPATLEIRENIENECPFLVPVRENSGNLGKTPKIRDNSGNSTVTQKATLGFRQFGICASCAMCPSFIHWLTGYGGFLVFMQ